jgi:hypothetical protein
MLMGSPSKRNVNSQPEAFGLGFMFLITILLPLIPHLSRRGSPTSRQIMGMPTVMDDFFGRGCSSGE